MSSTQASPGLCLWLLGATLTLAGLGAPAGCGSTAGQGTLVPDGGGGSGAAGAASSSSGGGAGGAGGRVGGAAGAGAAAGAGGSTCTNAPHVLPLNPSNPQDGITLGSFYVDTDTWNAASYQVSQTMYVCDYDNWYVVAKMDNATGDGAVKT